MIFEKTKEGDVVFTKKYVSTGWHSKEWFFISAKVERVTNTQIIVDGDRFRREDGGKVGRVSYQEYGKIFKPGEKAHDFRGWVTPEDQSNEMLALETLVSLRNECRLLDVSSIGLEWSKEDMIALIDLFRKNKGE